MDTSLDIDVTPLDLLVSKNAPCLGDILQEVDRQWPQGRDKSSNGHGIRIGTICAYFDHADVLHMHFASRGPRYLQPTGALKNVPVGHLDPFNVAPVFNQADTLAERAGELLVSLPKDVNPDDPRWNDIAELLAQMHVKTK